MLMVNVLKTVMVQSRTVAFGALEAACAYLDDVRAGVFIKRASSNNVSIYLNSKLQRKCQGRGVRIFNLQVRLWLLHCDKYMIRQQSDARCSQESNAPAES